MPHRSSDGLERLIMGLLETGRQVASMKILSYADADETADFEPDSFVLLLDDASSVTLTSGTDWTLEIESGSWPDLPEWAWPPQSWRYEEADVPIGSAGLETIREVIDLRNAVGEINGVRIGFDAGVLEFKSGESTTYSFRR